ncbi:GNAT family N-acetyltransferase [Rhodovastum atsumiense]|uniref:GNAT family N-acetyltransferase n=1 Tax=Rhodovastum atsumiense TaxID=504468 RepID=A0A5M6IKZ0_9PROT|nr:GNAT family N-acetyltransferase [Rhodovastum atsumiense]KAA5608842.1 GNAT family N-acetyltransferase [Rhodovastum atsumiense]CAH2599333.1 GNAT family N-acetyltransferase [Rhodovastum atsumiense]
MTCRRHGAATLSTECLDDPAALGEPWQHLWRRVRAPFAAPAWVLAWWRWFGTTRARVAVLRDGTDLLGVLPLYELPEAGKILPIGAGLADFQDALLAPEAPADAAERLLRTALAGASLPCHLCDLPPGAALRDAAPPEGWRTDLRKSDPCPLLRLPADVPPGQQRKLRMARHRAARAGGWSMEEADATGLKMLLWLHAARWCDGGVLADARVHGFLQDAAPALIREGAARLFLLRLGGAPAAACLALVAPGQLLLYMQGYDPTYRFESPGTLLLGAILEHATAAGLRELHLLRGDEAYKRSWGAVPVRNALRVLTPP